MTAGRAEAGTSLVETLIAVAALVVLLALSANFFLGRKAYALRAAVSAFGSLVDEARAVARTSGSGASLVVVPSDAGGFRARIYPYRPLEGAQPEAPVRAVDAPVALTAPGLASVPPFALFISSSGTVSGAAWTPDAGTLAEEPACDAPIALEFDDGFRREDHAIACGEAVLR
ncbi:MAG: hypothetical protein JO359_12365 [Candidatus Eremiobacteraeota bacterium]|nr:hypothetical protein [Candidatus Eremiobacteraeota bacterium]